MCGALQLCMSVNQRSLYILLCMSVNQHNIIFCEFHRENNRIKIWNNGKGIPVVMHKEEKMYVPTLIFGHLLTSSNYNDFEKKVTGKSECALLHVLVASYPHLNVSACF